ncbi:hypothetical protein L288_17790 [Sphingobium quisquiliarum P25]|uniref:HTH tetR-type domain-containing protein n=1 Tax=Sphingobium quisquiliarum P25 TaxID=1329909 RepID=T0GL63_9SPHN|nr:TetR family transcriptional regulator [Sphingobium quisquiliarum]EQB01437.1 hypothetical protein L288_17790 [Sphingobium quisquiliarum P25]EZP66090.1 TetR family transcriptional regulator [Sphingomonas paucimobilis]
MESGTANKGANAQKSRGGRPRQEVATRLASHILDVALEQFLARGVERVSMDEIAARAGTTKRTLYSRYGSKTGLLVAVVQWGIAMHMRPVAGAIPQGTVRERLVHVARRMLDLSLKPEIIGLEQLARQAAAQDIEIPGGRLTLSSQTGVELIQGILDEGSAAGSVHVTDTHFAAAFLLDALVIVPRARILWKQFENKPRAKMEYMERTLDLLASGMPFLSP